MSRPAGPSDFEFDRLKHLLLQPETDRLEAIEDRVSALDQRVGAPDRLEAATAEILVEAFRRTEVARHRELAGAVAPVVVAAIRNEIKNSKDMMVEALYPLTGRLVAAAVANAFRDLVADLNERLDRSLSTRHWRLRLQSLATGRPVSELALAEAQAPELRRLLLLERGSGVLVASWHADDESQDQSELVSGLIAAITEFATSVYGSRSGELRTLDLGEARVFLRGAPVYLVAAECAGVLRPEHEREIDAAFLSLVSRVDQDQGSAAPALEHMAQTLFKQQAPVQKSSGVPLLLVGCALIGLLAWWASGPILRNLHERRIETAFAQARAAHPEIDAFPLRLRVDHAKKTVVVAGLAPSSGTARMFSEAIGEAAAPYGVVTHVADIGMAGQLQDARRRENETAAQLADLAARAKTVDAQIAALAAATNEATRALRAETKTVSDRLSALAGELAAARRERLAALLADKAIYFSHLDTFADQDMAEKTAR
ncbi:MAG: hypothetical protein ACK5JM_01225, partial [Rhodoblastus sp.]